jgi:beta-xylosidase
MGMGPRAVGMAAMTVGAMAIFAIFGQPAQAASSTFTAPVYAGDFPDPSVILVSSGTYWAYATGSAGRNLQVMSSTDLHGWSAPTDPLPVLPGWASGGRTWAPGVLARGSRYVMYYTVHDRALNVQCISVATSTTPAGPYTDSSSGPLICQPGNGGSIDPNPFVDPVTNNLFLLWKSDDNALGPGHPTHIWGQQLANDGLALVAGTSPSLLLTASPWWQGAWWQGSLIEGPTMVRSGSTYYLFYGANNFDTASSGIGYATSRSLLGSYTNRSIFGPWLSSRGNAQGAQGPTVFTDSSGATRMAFAAWYGTVGYEHGGVRSLWVGTLGFKFWGSPTLN